VTVFRWVGVGVIEVGWRGLISMQMSIESNSKTKGNGKFKE